MFRFVPTHAESREDASEIFIRARLCRVRGTVASEEFIETPARIAGAPSPRYTLGERFGADQGVDHSEEDQRYRHRAEEPDHQQPEIAEVLVGQAEEEGALFEGKTEDRPQGDADEDTDVERERPG